MSVTRSESSDRPTGRKRQPHAAIVFGSAASHSGRRPASVRATCEAIGLPRSTFYYQSHRATDAIVLEQRIVQRLLELRDSHPNDGYRRMTRQLQLEGLHVNRKRIARLMHLHNLTVKPVHAGGDLVRHRQLASGNSQNRDARQPAGPDQVWISDLSYVRIESGLVYAAAVIDVWSREVVGYAASTHISARLASIALHSAVRAHRPSLGCIHRSTCGMQYLMRGYRELLREYGLVPVANDAAEPPALEAPLRAASTSGHQIVEMLDYATWDEVVARSKEFILSVYSSERIGGIVTGPGENGARGGVGVSGSRGPESLGALCQGGAGCRSDGI